MDGVTDPLPERHTESIAESKHGKCKGQHEMKVEGDEMERRTGKLARYLRRFRRSGASMQRRRPGQKVADRASLPAASPTLNHTDMHAHECTHAYARPSAAPTGPLGRAHPPSHTQARTHAQHTQHTQHARNKAGSRLSKQYMRCAQASAIL